MSNYKIGYARVSTLEQDPALQHDALVAAGCQRVFTDQASRKLESRPGLDDLLEHVRRGDTVVVWRLDRLGRSLRHLLETVSDLEHRGVGFISLTENIGPRPRVVGSSSTCLVRWRNLRETSSASGPTRDSQPPERGVEWEEGRPCGQTRSCALRGTCMPVVSTTSRRSRRYSGSAGRLCTGRWPRIEPRSLVA